MISNETFTLMIQVPLRRHSELTQQSYLDELRFFRTFIRDRPLATVSTSDALAYLDHLQRAISSRDGKPLADKTIRRKILTLFSIFVDAVDHDLAPSNPFEKVARHARNMTVKYKRKPKHVPFDKVSHHVTKADSIRDRAIFAILFGGGLRVSELVRLKHEDITQVGELIGLCVQTAKSGGERPVTLPPWASAILKTYLAICPTSAWLFPSRIGRGDKPITRKWVSNLCYTRFGSRAHTARHTHASYLLSKKVPIYDVARTLGHKSIASTLVYDQRILNYEDSASQEADFFHQTKIVVATTDEKFYE